MSYIPITEFVERYDTHFPRNLGTFEWTTQRVGESFVYDDSVSYHKLYAFNGIVMELVIRKYLCNKFNMPCKHDRTEKMLAQPSKFACSDMYHSLAKSYYAAYLNPSAPVSNIIDDIKMVALSEDLADCEDTEPFEYEVRMNVNPRNLDEITNYLDNMQYTTMVFQKQCDLRLRNGDILTGFADYIFDDNIFFQTTTSKYHHNPKEKLGQVILYIMGYYAEHYSGQDKQFTIVMYNPLLGNTFTTRFLLTPNEYDRIFEIINGMCIYM